MRLDASYFMCECSMGDVGFPTLQWHGDTFELPAGATRLAGSPAYRNQAFRIGRSYGLQLHVEVSLDLARDWGAVPAYAQSSRRRSALELWSAYLLSSPPSRRRRCHSRATCRPLA